MAPTRAHPTHPAIPSAPIHQAAKQRIELTHAERELSERHALEERLKADLRTAEQNEAYMKQQYVSQEQELEIKTGKLKQLWAAYKGREQELSELQEEFAAEREELMDHLREVRIVIVNRHRFRLRSSLASTTAIDKPRSIFPLSRSTVLAVIHTLNRPHSFTLMLTFSHFLTLSHPLSPTHSLFRSHPLSS
jgi:hypothetical protein